MYHIYQGGSGVDSKLVAVVGISIFIFSCSDLELASPDDNISNSDHLILESGNESQGASPEIADTGINEAITVDSPENFESDVVLEPVMIHGSLLACTLSKDRFSLICETEDSDLGVFVIKDGSGNIDYSIAWMEEDKLEITLEREVNQDSLVIEQDGEKAADPDPDSDPNLVENNGAAYCASIPYGTWVLVPGDTDYETNDFCVMKYEAKDNAGAPTSTPESSPWASLTQTEAISACSSLGDNIHLINNDEWMTIASNIASQGVNWDGGTVGINELARGHSDDNPSLPCAADPDDANAYVDTDCDTRTSSGTFNQRRTHTLSNGTLIWDLAGNVWEWTSYLNDLDKANPVNSGWIEYTLPVMGSATMPITDLIPTNSLKPFWDDSWNSSQSIGRFYATSNGSGGAQVRGAPYNGMLSAGVFTSDLGRLPTFTGTHVGFRCTASIPLGN